MRKRRKSGWTAFIIALVTEVAVLGAVGIYGSVAGGPTFQSRAFVNRVLSSPSATPSPTDVPAAAADPVEVDACTLVTPAEINLQLDTRFQADRALAGPGLPDFWGDEDAWWVSCAFEEFAVSERTFDVTVVTGPDLEQYLPADIDPTPLGTTEVPDDTPRAIPGLGEAAWIVAEEFEGMAMVSMGVQTETAIVELDYTTEEIVDIDGELAVLASQAVVQLPEVPAITPKRIGADCSAFDLTGAEKFADAELVGARELTSPTGDVTCGFAGVGSTLELRLLSGARAAEEHAFYRDAGRPVAGVGDEAYVVFVPIDELVQAYFYVRDGKRVFEVSYSVLDEGFYEPRTKPEAAEIALLKSLLSNAEMVDG